MNKEKRRNLTDEEKNQLLEKHINCYICQKPLKGYDLNEIEFDHIYSYTSGSPQDLNNFAPVHASKNNDKLNCHKEKGRKKPVEYREELRIKNQLKSVDSLKDIRKNALPSEYKILENKNEINFNGKTLPLYNQRIGNEDNYYFFHEIEIEYIENDDQIQLRPLEPKILPLIFNLKKSVQLLPSLGRIDKKENKIKLFDGQHKAVAQIIGNNMKSIPCIIFVEPSVAKLREVIYEAHTDFAQQRYKKSHMDAKLADIYKQKIDDYRKRLGDINAPYSEYDILHDETLPKARNFIMSSIIDEIRNERDFIRINVAQDKNEQKQKPMLWQSLERLIKLFCYIDPVDKISDDPKNYRSSEVENICFIIDKIEEETITNKWSPDNPEDLEHVLCRTYYYRTAFNNWIKILEKALRFSFEQMKGKEIKNAICYREVFDTHAKSRFSEIIRKCFKAPFWVLEDKQKIISGANKDSIVEELFAQEGFDYIYLTHIGTNN